LAPVVMCAQRSSPPVCLRVPRVSARSQRFCGGGAGDRGVRSARGPREVSKISQSAPLSDAEALEALVGRLGTMELTSMRELCEKALRQCAQVNSDKKNLKASLRQAEDRYQALVGDYQQLAEELELVYAENQRLANEVGKLREQKARHANRVIQDLKETAAASLQTSALCDGLLDELYNGIAPAEQDRCRPMPCTPRDWERVADSLPASTTPTPRMWRAPPRQPPRPPDQSSESSSVPDDKTVPGPEPQGCEWDGASPPRYVRRDVSVPLLDLRSVSKERL